MTTENASGGMSSDKTLMRRLQLGESDAATDLYVRYANRLLGLVRHQMSDRLERRADAEEIVQSVFRTFFRRATVGHYDVPEGEELWRLLLVIALNKIRGTADYHYAQRRDARRTTLVDGTEMEQRGEFSQNNEAFVALKLVIEELLETFAPVKADMIRMRIEGYEIEEISRQTRRSKRTIERCLQAFRSKLQEQLGDAAQ
jgi:RNA polymerase sigma-70 factor (ECF subfamily)